MGKKIPKTRRGNTPYLFLICLGLTFKLINSQFWHLAGNYTYVTYILCGCGIAGILLHELAKKILAGASLTKISEMSGESFEDYCIENFKRLGYSAKPTALTGDYGADIVLTKFGIKTVVQCKRYKSKVGVAAVQEIIAAKGYYKADKAMVVTNSFYTNNARVLAKANGVELWDRNDIKNNFRIKG